MWLPSHALNMESPQNIKTSRYIDPSFFDKEKEVAFGMHWLMAGISSLIPAPQSHHVVDILGRSILLTRDKEGKAHAFYNNCLHRGTILVRKAGKEKIQCPYHGWRYDHQGHLLEVKSPKGLRASPCNKGKLRTIACIERSGLLWINFSSEPEGLDSELEVILKDISAYKLAEMQPIEARDFSFSINWKIVLENALDFYHVSHAHASTVGAHVRQPPTFEDLGRHNLQTLFIAPYPWRSFLDERTARGGPYSEKQKQSLHKYFIFPNLVLNILPYHLTIMQLWPDDVGNCHMRYRFCLRKKAGILERARVYISWVASRWILYEDVRLYKGIQKGMAFSPFTRQPLHEEERAIAHFHKQLSLRVQD